jgi:hypothetical protein
MFTLLACSPEPTSSMPRLYTADFDGACAGLPCGWTQVAGAPGAAHTTAILLPGMRGLALVGDGVLVDGPRGDIPPYGLLGDELDVVVFARCDSGSTLTVQVALSSTTPLDGSTDAAVTLLEASLLPPTAWSTAMTTTDETRQALTPIVTPRESGLPVRVQSVTVLKEGPGQCEIDSLVIEARSYGGLYGTDGCV